MCIKEQYETISEARQVAQGFSRDKNQTMEPYKCDQCRKFHLRTAGKNKFKRRRRDNNKYPFRYQPPVQVEKQNQKGKRK